MDEEKIYHIPDWSRHNKGSSLTSWAICGKKVTKPPHWFPMGRSRVNCKACLEVQDAAGRESSG